MRFLIIICILLVFKGGLAQHNPPSFNDSLLLLEEKVWRDSNEVNKHTCFVQKAQLYINHRLYKQALNEYERINRERISDSLKLLINYKKALCYYLSDNADNAYAVLKPDSSAWVSTPSGRLFYTDLLIENEQWINAKQLLLYTGNNLRSALYDSIAALPQEIKYVDVYKCRKLSFFIPGSGQMKAGYTGKGFVALGTNLAFAGFTAYNIVGGYYATALVSGLMPLLKFYRGNVQLSGTLAERRNKKKQDALKQKYRMMLLRVNQK